MPQRQTVRLRFVALCLCGCIGVSNSWAEESAPTPNGLRLFIAPDDNSEIVTTIQADSAFVPIGDLVGGDGAKWFLVRSEAGATGWLKDSNGDVAKRVSNYFKPVPVTISLTDGTETSSSSSPSVRGRISVPVELSGAKVIVTVTFNHSVSANLALDTGAAMTMISRRIARNLGLSNMGSMVMTGIGGSVLTQMARIESVKVGDAAVGNLTVSIHDFSRDPHYEGLLGLDFLNHFEMSLDARKRQLFLTPR
jgi:Aspartyl protease